MIVVFNDLKKDEDIGLTLYFLCMFSFTYYSVRQLWSNLKIPLFILKGRLHYRDGHTVTKSGDDGEDPLEIE